MEYKITIQNFKSIIHSEFEIKKGLNILIGPNGAGKTCVLYSLKFLRDIFQKGVGIAMAKGGGPSRIFHRGKKSIRFDLEMSYGEKTLKRKKYESRCYWSIIIEQKGTDKIATIVKETLLVDVITDTGLIPLFKFDANRSNFQKPKITFDINPDSGKDLFNTQKNDHSRHTKEELFGIIRGVLVGICNSQEFKKVGERSVLTFLGDFDSSFFRLLRFFTSLNEYNIIPERARQATEQLPFARMNSNGFGISEVIEALEKKHFHRLDNDDLYDIDMEVLGIGRRFGYYYSYRGRYDFFEKRGVYDKSLDKINKELAAAVKPINKVSVEIDKTNGRRFVVFKSDKTQFYPDEVSDGTIKWLCILTSIYVGSSYIHLLEEPENFLHPWMQQKLIQIMRDQSRENGAIYVLTTHSTTLLNSAYPEEVITVEQRSKGTEVQRINSGKDIDDFLRSSNFGLGDLWVAGGIGAVP